MTRCICSTAYNYPELAYENLTIPLCRELKRNSDRCGYHCKQAQVKADGRKRRSQDYRDLTTGLLRKKKGKCVCVETVHAHVRADKVAGETCGNIVAIG